MSAVRQYLEDIIGCKDNLRRFVERMWPSIEGVPFKGNWHIDALCEHLQELYNGSFSNLLINLPPRATKSIITSVIFPAWVWLHKPETQFLCIANSYDLAFKFAMDSRNVITSEFYQNKWWQKIFQLSKTQNSKSRFVNSAKGYRVSCTFGSKITGKGGAYIICDDANHAHESESERDTINNIWKSTIYNRVNDPKTSKRIVMQQRTAFTDLSGTILKEDGDSWVKLILPMEHEKRYHCVTVPLASTNGKPWEDPRTKEGQLLWPEQFDAKSISSIKKTVGSYLYQTQYQQNPLPASGNIIKRSYFQLWKKPKAPELVRTVLSIDTAFGVSEENCYSAAVAFGIFKDEKHRMCAILLSTWRDRVAFPELRKIIKRLSENYTDVNMSFPQAKSKKRVDMVLIEDKAAGVPLLYELSKLGIPATRFNPNPYGDKVSRVHLITHYIENGRFYIPAEAPDFEVPRPFADDFVKQCEMFPKAESRDIVDCLTQFLIYHRPLLATQDND